MPQNDQIQSLPLVKAPAFRPTAGLGERMWTGFVQAVKRAFGSAIIGAIGGAALGGLFGSLLPSGDKVAEALKDAKDLTPKDVATVTAARESGALTTGSLMSSGAITGALAGAAGGAIIGAAEGTFFTDKIKNERAMAAMAAQEKTFS